jgi:hypothetical protein
MTETEAKIYRVAPLTLWLTGSMLLCLTALGVLVCWRVLTAAEAPVAVVCFMGFWLIVMLWVWVTYLKIPLKIIRHANNSLEFVSVMGATTLKMEEIISIKASPMSLGFLHLKHRGGALRLYTHMTGLFEVVGFIKASNPAVKIKGY